MSAVDGELSLAGKPGAPTQSSRGKSSEDELRNARAQCAPVRTCGESVPLTSREATAFGVVLGLGYLAKAVMLPVGLAALVAFALLGWRRRSRGSQFDLVRAAVTYVLIAAPLVAVQTYTQGHLSFGETGRLNYRWYVSRAGEAGKGTQSCDRSRS